MYMHISAHNVITGGGNVFTDYFITSVIPVTLKPFLMMSGLSATCWKALINHLAPKGFKTLNLMSISW